MSNEKDNERSERVWITWDDAYPWPTPESGGDEYVRADLLTTAREEARQQAFREAVAIVVGFPVERYLSSGTHVTNALTFRDGVIKVLEAAATTQKGDNDAERR